MREPREETIYDLVEVSEITGVDREVIVRWIRKEWISPPSQTELDWEDVTRIRFIQELAHDFGANDDAIPLILHLVDQLCYLRTELRRHAA